MIFVKKRICFILFLFLFSHQVLGDDLILQCNTASKLNIKIVNFDKNHGGNTGFVPFVRFGNSGKFYKAASMMKMDTFVNLNVREIWESDKCDTEIFVTYKIDRNTGMIRKYINLLTPEEGKVKEAYLNKYISNIKKRGYSISHERAKDETSGICKPELGKAKLRTWRQLGYSSYNDWANLEKTDEIKFQSDLKKMYNVSCKKIEKKF